MYNQILGPNLPRHLNFLLRSFKKNNLNIFSG